MLKKMKKILQVFASQSTCCVKDYVTPLLAFKRVSIALNLTSALCGARHRHSEIEITGAGKEALITIPEEPQNVSLCKEK
jgi:hypothetical protein